MHDALQTLDTHLPATAASSSPRDSQGGGDGSGGGAGGGEGGKGGDGEGGNGNSDVAYAAVVVHTAEVESKYESAPAASNHVTLTNNGVRLHSSHNQNVSGGETAARVLQDVAEGGGGSLSLSVPLSPSLCLSLSLSQVEEEEVPHDGNVDVAVASEEGEGQREEGGAQGVEVTGEQA